MTLRWFNPEEPWSNSSHQKVRLYGNRMPLVHAASIMGCDKLKVTNIARGNRISYAPAVPGVEYGAYLYVEDFPKILRSLKWDEDDIGKGMAQIMEVVNRPHHARSNNNKKPEEEETAKPSRKRVNFDSPPPSEDDVVAVAAATDEPMPKWARELIEHVDRGVTTCFAMTGAQAVPFYFGTKRWQAEKPGHIQARLDSMMPRWEAEVKADLTKKWEKVVEQEVRDRKTKEFESNMEKEDVYQMAEFAGRKADAIVVSLPIVVEQQQGDFDEEDIRKFLKNYHHQHQQINNVE
jgi:hypothetical protein